MIKFRQKEFSVFRRMSQGAALGMTTFGGSSAIFKKKDKKKENLGFSDILTSAGGGLIIGASLGLIYGLVEEALNKTNRKKTVDNRFLKSLVLDLKTKGYTEGVQFTRDRNKANQLKTKVCLVISKESGCLNLIINTVSDKKLTKLTEEVVNNIPNSSVVNQKITDRFNEITVSSITEGAEVGLLGGIIERFIHEGYSVYLVEVG